MAITSGKLKFENNVWSPVDTLADNNALFLDNVANAPTQGITQ